MGLKANTGTVINFNSKAFQRGKLDETRLRDTSGIAGVPNRIVVTKDPEHLFKTVGEFSRQGINIIFDYSGDGGAHLLYDAILKQYHHDNLPIVVILGGGTINMHRGGLGYKGSPYKIQQQAISEIINAHRDGRPIETIDKKILQVEADNEVMHGGIFGFGALSNILDEYYRDPNITDEYCKDPNYGPAKFFKVLGKGYVGLILDTCDNPIASRLHDLLPDDAKSYYKVLLKNAEGEVTIDGEKQSYNNHRLCLISSMNMSMDMGARIGSKHIGLSFQPFFMVDDDDPKTFHLRSGELPEDWFYSLEAASMLRKKRVVRDNLYDGVAEEFILRVQKPTIYTIDAEMYAIENYVKVTAPNTLRFMDLGKS
ncbi:diacylglycerol kinase family protein [Nanoarchaeota archaeon]